MSRADTRAVLALFRLIAARLGTEEIAAYVLQSGTPQFLAATESFQACLATGGLSPKAELNLPPAVLTALSRGGPVRVEPTELGLRSAFAALQPVRVDSKAAGFLLFLDSRQRRLGPESAAAMQDAALLLAPLLNGRSLPEARSPEMPVGDGILPLAEAHRMIGAARQKNGARRSSAVLLLDMDRFGAINAALGAAAGDSLLAITATRLERSVGETERLARLSADRFLILSTRPEAELPDLAARLLASVGEPLALAGQSITMQATIGIVGPQAASTPDASIFMKADTALRRGKAEGGNRVVLHEPKLNAAHRDRSRLELDLPKAIGAGQLRLVFQPYISLDTDRLAGVEALLRWDHPLRGELPPAEFIGLAEATGQILPIGAWALRAALSQAAEWPGETRLSVNISALQFNQPDFTARVDAALAASGFPAERLELEITETVPMRNNPETVGQIRTLIARGIKIALDDFGTGYTALAYLTRLPHHRIKLDHSFVQDLGNPATGELIRAIVASARSQGIAVTAEGVETRQQLEEVRRIGFTHAQGFVTGAPVADPLELFRPAHAMLA